MKKIFTLSVLLAFLSSCSSPGDNISNKEETDTVSENLHLSFTTPNWSQKIDCSHLVLDASSGGTTTTISATSQSTNETFYLVVPTDSTSFSKIELKKYPISFSGGLSFNQKLPVTRGNSLRMYGVEKFDTTNNYNEITSVNYDKSDNSFAYFKIKASYKMTMETADKQHKNVPVSGTYHFLVKTRKN